MRAMKTSQTPLASEKMVLTMLKRAAEESGYKHVTLNKLPLLFSPTSAFRLGFDADQQNEVLDDYTGILVCKSESDGIWSSLSLHPDPDFPIAQQLENVAKTHSLWFEIFGYISGACSKVLVWKAGDTFWETMIKSDLGSGEAEQEASYEQKS